MTQLPRISIVTPSLNQGAYISDALASVYGQHYANIEHLVVDGGSCDGTLNILSQCSQQPEWNHLQWTSSPDTGQANALNNGFARTTGDIIGWLNSDDRYRPGCLETVAAVFEDNPAVDIVYGNYTWIRADGTVYRIRREIDYSYFVLLYHRILYIPTTATFFRRRVFAEGNRLNESFHYAMDFEFFVRLGLHGYRFKHIPVVLADFRFQPESKSLRAPECQLNEVDQAMAQHSKLSQYVQSPHARKAGFAVLRGSAAMLRYSQKLLRGYYFDRFRLSSLA